MSGDGYHSNKRDRENARAKKREQKEQRRMERRERGPGKVDVVSAAELTRGIPSTAEAMRAIEQRSTEARSVTAIPARLFVGGLAEDVTTEVLRTAFSAVAPVADAFVVVDRDSRRSRGFGFVTMADRKDAPAAIAALDGSELHGRNIVVNVASERADSGRGRR